MSDSPDREQEFDFQIHQQRQSQNTVHDMGGLILFAWVLETGPEFISDLQHEPCIPTEPTPLALRYAWAVLGPFLRDPLASFVGGS